MQRINLVFIVVSTRSLFIAHSRIISISQGFRAMIVIMMQFYIGFWKKKYDTKEAGYRVNIPKNMPLDRSSK